MIQWSHCFFPHGTSAWPSFRAVICHGFSVLRIRSDLVTTQDCSPTPCEYLLKYSDLHLEYLWRTSCYMYPSEWSILTRIPYIFPVFTPKFDRLVWLKYAFSCLPIYRVGRYGYVAYAQKIWSSYPYLFSTYRSTMQVKNVLKFNEFSTLPTRCD